MIGVDKFGALVEDVRGRIERKFYTGPIGDTGFAALGQIFKQGYQKKYKDIEQHEKSTLDRGRFNIALILLFNYDELNDYAKVIVDRTQAFFLSKGESDYALNKKLSIGKYEISESFDEYKRKGFIEELISLKENEYNEDEFLRLIFWSLMIMAVDKKTAAKKLQDICEYSKLFGLSEKSVILMFKVINMVLGSEKAKRYAADTVQKYADEAILNGVYNSGKGELMEDLKEVFKYYRKVYYNR